MRRLLLFCSFVFTFGSNLQAQNNQHKWALGINFGISEYSGDLGNGFFKTDLKGYNVYTDDGSGLDKQRPRMLGLSVSRFINKNLDVQADLIVGRTGYYLNLDYYFFTGFTTADIIAKWKFVGNEAHRFQPYLLAGTGIRICNQPSINDFGTSSVSDLVIPVGIGFNFKLLDRVNLNVQSNYGWTNGDKMEGSERLAKFSFDQYWNHSVGFNFLLGK